MATMNRRNVLAGLGGAAIGFALFGDEAATASEITSEDGSWSEDRGLALVDSYASTDAYDSARIQAAIDDSVTRGLGGILLAGRAYELNVPVNIPPVSGFLIQGTDGRTRLQRTPSGRTECAFRIEGQSGDLHENIRFDGLAFIGGMQNLEQLGTRRARGAGDPASDSSGAALVVWNAGKLASAVSVNGDKTQLWNTTGPVANLYGTVRNISVTNCVFLGTQGLPVFFRGVRGYARVTNSLFRRCLDPGWIFCDSAQFIGNRSEYSMDNGASLSRGCDHAIAANNTILGAWFSGVMVGGFKPTARTETTPQAAVGPRRVTVSGNVIENPGEYGVCATDSGGQLAITGNTIMGVHPTASGTTGRAQGVGIVVSEWDADDMPRSVTISGNAIEDTARGGIIVHNARSTTIVGNTLRLMGTRDYPGGEPRDGTAGTQLFGISHGGTESALNALSTVVIVGNTVADQRGAASATHHPIFFPPGGHQLIQNNLAMGTVQPAVTAP